MQPDPTFEFDEEPEEALTGAVTKKSSRRRHSKPRSHFAAVQRPRWESWLLAAIPLIACFLGGGRSVFAKGVAVTSVGLLVLIAPPNYRLPKLVLVALGTLVAAPLLSFLPATWLAPLPEWRVTLMTDWGLNLAASATPQPWVTLESWFLFISGLVWLSWCASRGSTLDDRRRTLRMMVLGIAVIAVLTLGDKAKLVHIGWWKFPLELGDTFGPFANRNHTSSLMAMASILCIAVAYDSYRNKQRRWLLFLLFLAPFFMVIVSNTSRAGVLLFFLGITVWLWTSAMRKSFFKKVALISTLVLVGVSVTLFVGGSLTSRFAASFANEGAGDGVGGRSALYSDVVKMTSQSPWTGVGLGNFVDVYPQVSSFHEPRMRFLHPESDIFWLMAEGGMITLISFSAMLLLFASMTGPWSGSREDESGSRQDRRLRHASAIAAWIAVMHGVVDVPNHGLGYALFSGVLLAFALRPSQSRTPAAWTDRLAFRAFGLCILLFGASLIATFLGVPVLPGRSSAKLMAQQARALSTKDRDGEALVLADRAINMNPLDWTLHFLRGSLRLKLKYPEREALLDFGRARAIEPHYAKMCVEEGDVWLAHHSRFTVQAWKEFLRRQPEQIDYYNLFLTQIRNEPDLRLEAQKLAITPPLKVAFLRQTPRSPEFDEVLNELIQYPKGLEALEPEGRLEFFRLWQERGNRDELKTGLQKNPFWQQDGWRVLCEEFAREGSYEAAYRLATRFELPPISPSVSDLHDFAELQHNFDLNPIDPRRGLDLYFAQKAKGAWDAALLTLEKISGLPNAPSYINFETSVIYAQKQDFRKAWELMSKYLSDHK